MDHSRIGQPPKQWGRPWSHVAISIVFVSLLFGVPAVAQGQERGGFTLIVDLGMGFQRDGSIGYTKKGVAGITGGVGVFLHDDTAFMLRLMGTSADYRGTLQASGVFASTVQYWPADRLNVELGAGLGVRSMGDGSDGGLGVIAGVGYTLFRAGSHSFQVAVQYAPAFTQPATVHNFGVTFGWQVL